MDRIKKSDLEKFNSVFDVKSFVENYDYKSNTWFKNSNFKLLLIDWFLFSRDNLEKFSFFFNKFRENRKKIYLTDFPINLNAKCFSFENVIEIESLDNNFFELYSKVSFIIFDADFNLFLIHEIDIEVFYICFDEIYNFENIDKNLLLDYDKYMTHSKELKNKGLI
jgi:hypothetical protein